MRAFLSQRIIVKPMFDIPEYEMDRSEDDYIWSEKQIKKINILSKAILQVLHLKSSDLDIRRSFISLGGDSIKAYSCIRVLQNEGYELSYRHFKAPLSLAELSQRIVPISRPGGFREWNRPFAPTPLISRFLQYSYDIGSVAQTVCMEFTQPFELQDGQRLLEWIYHNFPTFHLNVTQDNMSLFFRQDICLPKVITVSSSELAALCCFDVYSEGLLKMFHLQDSNRVVLCAHHLAIDFVSWSMLLEEVNQFIGDAYHRAREDNSFQEYCTACADEAIYLEKSTKKKYIHCLTIEDVELIGRFTLCTQQMFARPEHIIKRCLVQLYCQYHMKDDVVIELEYPGRGKGEYGIGWYTDVSYERHTADGGMDAIPLSALRQQDSILRFNYIPFEAGTVFSSFRVVDDESHFVWHCDLDYAAEIDALMLESKLQLHITSHDKSLIEYLESTVEDKLAAFLADVRQEEDIIQIDDTIDLEDIKKLFANF